MQQGGLTLSFRREPSYFAACSVLGQSAEEFVGRDTQTGALAGVGARDRPAVMAAALAVAVLVSLTAATAPSSWPRPEDRPVGTTLRPRRAGYALALAPVGAAGVVAHVMVGFLA